MKKISLIVTIAVAVVTVAALIGVLCFTGRQNGGTDPTTSATTTEPDTSEPESTTEAVNVKEIFDDAGELIGQERYDDSVAILYELYESGAELSDEDMNEMAQLLSSAYAKKGLTYSSYRVLEERGIESERPTVQPVISGVLSEWKHFYFGEYPQDRVEDLLLVSILSKLEPVDDVVSYLGRKFAVLTVDDEKRFYEYMPIEWEMFYPRDGFGQMMSEKVLDQHVFHEAYVGGTWDACDLRKWMNDTFYNMAFTDYEKESMKLMHYDRSYQYLLWFYTGEPVDDYVSTLPGVSLLNNPPRYAQPTDYAVDKGVYVSKEGYSRWWIQTSLDKQGMYTMYVTEYGLLGDAGIVSNNDSVGVRPIIGILNDFLN